MLTSSISSSFSSPAAHNASQQRRADFRALANALQANDLGAARQALTALQQNIERAAPPQARAAAGATASRRSAVRAIGAALDSGDIAGAQKAFAALQQTHIHRRRDGADAMPPVAEAAVAQAATSAPGSLLNLRV